MCLYRPGPRVKAETQTPEQGSFCEKAVLLRREKAVCFCHREKMVCLPPREGGLCAPRGGLFTQRKAARAPRQGGRVALRQGGLVALREGGLFLPSREDGMFRAARRRSVAPREGGLFCRREKVAPREGPSWPLDGVDASGVSTGWCWTPPMPHDRL